MTSRNGLRAVRANCPTHADDGRANEIKEDNTMAMHNGHKVWYAVRMDYCIDEIRDF